VEELNTIFLSVPWYSSVEKLLKILAHEYYHKVYGEDEEEKAYTYARQVVKEARRRRLL